MADTDRPYAHMPDKELVALVKCGDEAALSALYRRYVGPIYRFIMAQVREVQDAEDLCSETFARMLRGLGGFRGSASFKNWLYQIARNAVRNHRRAAGYRKAVPLSPRMRQPTGPAGDAQDEDDGRYRRALALLQQLPPRYRQVLELRFLDGRTIADTAAEMGVSVSNAKVLQHRALKKVAAVREDTRIASGRRDG